MKTSFLLAIAALTCFSAPLHAAEDTSPAMRLIELMDFAKIAKAGAAGSFAPFLQQMKAKGMPDAALKEVSTAAERFFTKTFDDPGIKADLVAVYKKAYTDEEMEALLTFYETPVGKKSLLVMPQIMQESSKIGQKYALKNQADFQSEMQEIMAKYPAPAPSK